MSDKDAKPASEEPSERSEAHGVRSGASTCVTRTLVILLQRLGTNQDLRAQRAEPLRWCRRASRRSTSLGRRGFPLSPPSTWGAWTHRDSRRDPISCSVLPEIDGGISGASTCLARRLVTLQQQPKTKQGPHSLKCGRGDITSARSLNNRSARCSSWSSISRRRRTRAMA